MQYCELGEARILKRYKTDELIKPARKSVVQSSCANRWQTLDQATSRYVEGLKTPCVTAQ